MILDSICLQANAKREPEAAPWCKTIFSCRFSLLRRLLNSAKSWYSDTKTGDADFPQIIGETISNHFAESCDFTFLYNRDMTFPEWETLIFLHLWGNGIIFLNLSPTFWRLDHDRLIHNKLQLSHRGAIFYTILWKTQHLICVEFKTNAVGFHIKRK